MPAWLLGLIGGRYLFETSLTNENVLVLSSGSHINVHLGTESVVDLTIVFRDADTGKRISTQNLRGEAKYEQKTWVGVVNESGKYYVKDSLITSGSIGDQIRADISNGGWVLTTP